MKRLLLVDDDELLVRQLRRELAAENYEVVTAGDGSLALAQFDRFDRDRPDVVILDWGLRGALDGIEILRRIRARSTTPVLMLTARGELEDKLVGLEVGADDYLVKPFARKELLARLKALLRRAVPREREADPPRALEDGPLVLDPGSHRALLNGKELALTKSEFALLALLLAHPDRVFHRGYLLDRLRGDDYAGTERAIDSAIVRVRRKLGKLGKRVETVFGIGYRWARSER